MQLKKLTKAEFRKILRKELEDSPWDDGEILEAAYRKYGELFPVIKNLGRKKPQELNTLLHGIGEKKDRHFENFLNSTMTAASHELAMYLAYRVIYDEITRIGLHSVISSRFNSK